MTADPAGSEPTVSVVMPTYNRRGQAARAVAALADQRVDEPFEIVVVSDGSTDGTEAALAELPAEVPIRVLTQDNAGPAAARNRGVEAAIGDLIVFIDDDLVAADGLLQTHVDAHRRLGPDVVVIGPMLHPPDAVLQPWVRWEQAMLDKQYRAMEEGEWSATSRQFYTGNASLARRHLVAAGGFDIGFRRAEDVELAYRLEDDGLRFEFLPEAVGFHYASRSFEAWRTVAYAYGRNDAIFARDRGRDWIFPFMATKYRQPRGPLRWLIALGVRSPVVADGIASPLRLAAAAADRIGLGSVNRAALSCIYGIGYHRGIADELGGADAFFELVQAPDPAGVGA